MPFGMMMGGIPTSIPMIILMANWLLEGEFKQKWVKLKASRIFWVLVSVFFIHCIGLIYTQNFKDGLRDIQVKLPIFLIPLIFFSVNLPTIRELNIMLYSFILGTFIDTAWCIVYSFFINHTETLRETSRFMSHIRLGLFINMAICCCFYFFKHQKTIFKKILFLCLATYFITTLLVMGLASGLFHLLILSIAFCLLIILKQQLKLKLIALSLLLGCIFLFVNYVAKVYKSQFYTHNTINKSKEFSEPVNTQMENGNLVFTTVNNTELKQQWQKHFPADSFNFQPSFHNINRYYVILRYLASKNLSKDSAGMTKLSGKDLIHIKNNITNYLYPDWGFLHKRIYELVNEYDELKHGRHVNGHSLTMRFYFWKASLNIIKENLFFGVGTGDVQQQLNETYIKTKSPLSAQWYKRPHNQFITITVALGFTGLLIFIFNLLYPLIKLKKHLHVLYFPFFILLISSFFYEDTIESQAGVSFYVVFNTVFLSYAASKKQQLLEG